MSKIIDKVKDLINSFYCEACGKKCDNREQPKYQIYLEKWFDRDAKSATEVKLCPECAAPVVDVVKKAKAFASLKKDDIELDPHSEKKPYHF
jgi:NAD-dependent SIR2 family protein deacetylase